MKRMLGAVSVFFALIVAALAYLALLVVPIVLLTMWEDWVGLLAIFVWVPLVAWASWMSLGFYNYEESV